MHSKEKGPRKRHLGSKLGSKMKSIFGGERPSSLSLQRKPSNAAEPRWQSIGYQAQLAAVQADLPALRAATELATRQFGPGFVPRRPDVAFRILSSAGRGGPGRGGLPPGAATWPEAAQAFRFSSRCVISRAQWQVVAPLLPQLSSSSTAAAWRARPAIRCRTPTAMKH